MVGKNVGSAVLSLALLLSVSRVDAMQRPDLSTKKGKAVAGAVVLGGAGLVYVGGQWCHAKYRQNNRTLEQVLQEDAAKLAKPEALAGDDEAWGKELAAARAQVASEWNTGIEGLVKAGKDNPVQDKDKNPDRAATRKALAEGATGLRAKIVGSAQHQFKLNRSKSFSEKLSGVAGLLPGQASNFQADAEQVLATASNGKVIDVPALRSALNANLTSARDLGTKQLGDKAALAQAKTAEHAKEVENKGKAADAAAGVGPSAS